ncbi:ABC transporter permease [Enterococcus durans]|uniref:ABC transporter permease n=1 Tax=Enterococcus durans TaxID=53345 RepID=UPI0039A42961
MNNFFQLRLAKHQKKMMKYMRYVLNDHFVLICLFLIGGVGFYYSNWLKTLTTPFQLGGVILSVLWLLCLYFGKFASFTRAADIVFLLPKEEEMRGYLQQAFRYSCIFPFIFLGLICGFSMPLLVVSTGRPFTVFFFYLIMLWCMKSSQLQIKRAEVFRIDNRHLLLWKGAWAVSSLLMLFFSFYWIWIGLVGAIAQAIIYGWFLWKKMDRRLDWEKMVQIEEHRLHQIYQFINLFTDVPEITSKVKRRKYFDPLLERISKTPVNTYYYLYMRRFVRGTDFSGLVFRLTLIGGILIASMSDVYFISGIGALFIYLIGFQLLPLYNQFRYMTLVKLYPVQEEQKKRAIQKLLLGVLLAVAILFGLLAAIVLSGVEKVIPLIIYLVAAGLFVGLYAPARLKKMDD